MPNRSSNQSWSPNSGQVTEDGSRNPALDARFRATAAFREQPHFASTTVSASWHTDAVSLFTEPATDWIGSVPAYWEQPGAAY